MRDSQQRQAEVCLKHPVVCWRDRLYTNLQLDPNSISASSICSEDNSHSRISPSYMPNAALSPAVELLLEIPFQDILSTMLAGCPCSFTFHSFIPVAASLKTNVRQLLVNGDSVIVEARGL